SLFEPSAQDVPAVIAVDRDDIDEIEPFVRPTLHADERDGAGRVKPPRLGDHLAEELKPRLDCRGIWQSPAEQRPAHRFVRHAPEDCARVVLVAGNQFTDLLLALRESRGGRLW